MAAASGLNPELLAVACVVLATTGLFRWTINLLPAPLRAPAPPNPYGSSSAGRRLRVETSSSPFGLALPRHGRGAARGGTRRRRRRAPSPLGRRRLRRRLRRGALPLGDPLAQPPPRTPPIRTRAAPPNPYGRSGASRLRIDILPLLRALRRHGRGAARGAARYRRRRRPRNPPWRRRRRCLLRRRPLQLRYPLAELPRRAPPSRARAEGF
ncbi:hypothetical protein ACP4OV_023661 [Aristida adscensionis]